MFKQNISKQDLRDAFSIVAERKGILPLIVEKDFWITWCLGKLFTSKISVGMVFKGGTSLSKGYNLINRLSEDCDITINRTDLGFTGGKDPLLASSRKKRDRLLEDLKLACSDFVTKTIRSVLIDSMTQDLKGETWDILLQDDPQSLRFFYPSLLDDVSYETNDYIPKSVLLEFGVRGDVYPTENRQVMSYISDELNGFFDEKYSIPCLLPVRTFWEKATLLHAEFYRPSDKPTPERISRHYYDLSRLHRAGFSDEALNNINILNDVVRS